MGFDHLTQKTMRNSVVEFGEIDFSADDIEVEVPTRLNTVLLNFGVDVTDNRPVKGDNAVTNGKVTFTRPDDGGSSGATMQYIMAGY